MNIMPAYTVYNRDKPIAPDELHAIVQDMRYNYVLLVDRHEAQAGAFSLDWMGMYGHYHMVFCRDRGEVDAMTLRLRGAGYDGDIHQDGEQAK